MKVKFSASFSAGAGSTIFLTVTVETRRVLVMAAVLSLSSTMDTLLPPVTLMLLPSLSLADMAKRAVTRSGSAMV